ncbi:MAG: NAD(P)H-dependent oxidoreductase [Gammaproteobacteria bacterium]
MSRRIVIVQGHPDPGGGRYGHALAQAYLEGATEAGHEVDILPVAEFDFPLLRTKQDFEGTEPPEVIVRCQQAIKRADHLVIIHPLWLGSMPALLKGFLEQVFRPGFAFGKPEKPGRPGAKLLRGKSARVIVTMGMPGFAYRWFYRAHAVKSMERNILAFTGFGPIHRTLIGMVEVRDDAGRKKRLAEVRKLGAQGR